MGDNLRISFFISEGLPVILKDCEMPVPALEKWVLENRTLRPKVYQFYEEF